MDAVSKTQETGNRTLQRGGPMTVPRHKKRLMPAAVHLVACAILAVTLSAVSALAQTARPLEKITFLLDFTAYGKHAPFFVALDKGFWKDAGFDASIIKGEGSATTISSYAAGTVDFAFA